MYITDVLVPFNILVDTDMGLLKLVEFDYNNDLYFLQGILHTSETNQQYAMVTRTKINPLSVILQYDDNDLAENLYSQFMEKEYVQILKLSCNTSIRDLSELLNTTIDQVIRITILCKSEQEQREVEDRHIKSFRTIVESDLNKINLSDYQVLFVKSIYDLDRYRNVTGLNIYVPNYGFNITIDPEMSQPLLPEDILKKYGKENEFEIFSIYTFDPRKIPLG